MPVGNKSNRSRVQGGWAKPSSAISKPSSKQREEKASENIQKLPVWVGKGSEVDDPPNIAIRFQQPDEKDLKLDDTHTRLITEPGVYDLSAEPSGVSRIKLFHNFIDEKSAARMFTELSNEVPWEQKSDVRDGVRYLQPRVVAWYGDQGYSYSGLSHSPRPQLLPPLAEVKHMLEENTGLQFNSVLCNLYRDNKDHVSWHSDDEQLFGRLPTIASVSLGDTRMFELRRKVKPNSEGEFVYKEFVKVPLPAGSLLLMEGATQLDWQEFNKTESEADIFLELAYMGDFSRIGRAGMNAVTATYPSSCNRPTVKLGQSGRFFCACDDQIKRFMMATSESVIGRGGAVALLVLAGTFAGRVYAKILHKNGGITCFTYRKLKDLATHQPWFCIPLISVPLVNFSSVGRWRPPFLTYTLLVAGWILNTSGHVLMITTKEEKYKKYCIPVSYVSLALSGVAALLGLYAHRSSCCC